MISRFILPLHTSALHEARFHYYCQRKQTIFIGLHNLTTDILTHGSLRQMYIYDGHFSIWSACRRCCRAPKNKADCYVIARLYWWAGIAVRFHGKVSIFSRIFLSIMVKISNFILKRRKFFTAFSHYATMMMKVIIRDKIYWRLHIEINTIFIVGFGQFVVAPARHIDRGHFSLLPSCQEDAYSIYAYRHFYACNWLFTWRFNGAADAFSFI